MGCQGCSSQHSKVLDRCATPTEPRTEGPLTLISLGKAYQIKDTIRGRYYYPKDTGTKFSLPSFPRLPQARSYRWERRNFPVIPQFERGRTWGMDFARCGQLFMLRKPGQQSHPQFYLQTPASCSNIALHNLFSGEIDLVVGASGVHRTLSEPIHQYFLCIVQISGPNYGRNTSCESHPSCCGAVYRAILTTP